MARTVFCEYLKQEAEGLDFQLYPGSWVSVFLTQSASKRGLSGLKNRQ